MKHINTLPGFILIGAMAFSGCQTGGGNQMQAIELGPDATPLSMAELYDYFAGQTQLRRGGGVYYSDSGTLVALEDGERSEGTWASQDGGKLCRLFEDGEDSCENYYHYGDEVAVDIAGTVTLAPKKMDGNQLDLLEAENERKLFTREETIALVSGKTHAWKNHNGAYYSPDFRLFTLWDGEMESGIWSVTDDGALCWHIPSWGLGSCESYFVGDDGKLMSVYKGKESPADKLLKGNVLNEL